jgi:hypothetical protein
MTEEAGIVATPVACQLLMLSRQRLDQLAAAGWIARVSKGRWRIVDLVQGYIRYLKDEERRASKTFTLSRVQEARANEIEARTARDAGQTIAMSDALELVDVVVGGLKADLDGLPARFTRDMVQRRKLETEVNDALTRCADRLDEEADDLKAGGAADPAAPAVHA